MSPQPFPPANSLRRSSRRNLFAGLTFASALLFVGFAYADEAASSTREAGRHFQRGVALYGEADYRAALVEFKRAYALAPNATVLYNVGETEFQLQDYAGALMTFERYLAESSPSESHRAEVDSSVEVLRTRVGHLVISATPPGADVTVDDQPVGKTPLDKPLLVSIGHRKVAASMPGRTPVTRYVDVAADDNTSVSLQLAAPSESGSGTPSLHAASVSGEPASDPGPALRIVGWLGTAALAGGAVTFGVLANKESSDLQKTRATFPVSGATLTHMSNLTGTYSLVADCFSAAAVVLGGVTLFSTVTSLSSSSRARGSAGAVRVGVGPGSAHFEMTF